MSDINNGGQESPFFYASETEMLMLREPGMALRDYFAGQALKSMNLSFYAGPAAAPIAAEYAAYAYVVADAMLAARGKAVPCAR